MLLDEGSSEGVAAVAEVVRLAVRDVAMPDGCALEGLTASIGISTYPDHGGTLDQPLGRADRAMYPAKHAGRQRQARAQ